MFFAKMKEFSSKYSLCYEFVRLLQSDFRKVILVYGCLIIIWSSVSNKTDNPLILRDVIATSEIKDSSIVFPTLQNHKHDA